jgi:hypothetical protein
VFANRTHGGAEILRAGLLQGTLSACITFGLKRLIETLVHLLPGRPGLVLPPLACGALSIALLTVAHLLAGTAALLETIALPASVATGYAALYTLSLWERQSVP